MVHELKETLLGMLFSPHKPHLLQKSEDIWTMMEDAEGQYLDISAEGCLKK